MAVEVVRGLLPERTSCNQDSGGPKNGESHGIIFDSFHNESLPKGEHQRHIHERAPFHATRCDVEGEYSREPSAHQAGTKPRKRGRAKLPVISCMANRVLGHSSCADVDSKRGVWSGCRATGTIRI